jgi:uncharacterized protein
MLMKLFIESQIKDCEIISATNFLTRARGLLFCPALKSNQGLWITKCSSIHTIGMFYSIDVVFLDVNLLVTRIAPNVAPFRFRVSLKADSVLELNAGVANKLGIHKGQSLLFR